MGEIIDKVKGKFRHVAGALSGDKKLEREGEVDQANGTAKGVVEDDVKQTVKDAGRNSGQRGR